jgi:hypothetical protein
MISFFGRKVEVLLVSPKVLLVVASTEGTFTAVNTLNPNTGIFTATKYDTLSSVRHNYKFYLV